MNTSVTVYTNDEEFVCVKRFDEWTDALAFIDTLTSDLTFKVVRDGSKLKQDYYQQELNKLNPTSAYPHSIKIWDGEGHYTSAMDLNRDSIPRIIQFLQEFVEVVV